MNLTLTFERAYKSSTARKPRQTFINLTYLPKSYFPGLYRPGLIEANKYSVAACQSPGFSGALSPRPH